ncbi:MAG: hypothetical protein WBC04_09470 [Candidatus Acidiferrales bacterium]
MTRFTFGGNYNSASAWTPDGKRIAFESNKEGPQNVFWQLADSSGGLERLTTSEYANVPMSWSPDGQLLAFMEVNPSTGLDIWVLRMGQIAENIRTGPFSARYKNALSEQTTWPLPLCRGRE